MDNFLISMTPEVVVSIYDTILCHDCKDDWVNHLTTRNCSYCDSSRLSTGNHLLKGYEKELDIINNQLRIEIQKRGNIVKPGLYIVLETDINPAKYETFHNWLENHCQITKGRFFTKHKFIGSILNTPEYIPNHKDIYAYVMPC